MKKLSTNAKMRIAIAKDVLRQLDAKKIIAEQGTYCDLTNKPKPEEVVSLQKHFKDANTKCFACAVGSLFISYVNLYNNYNTNGRVPYTEIAHVLGNVFSKQMQDNIEGFFENWPVSHDPMDDKPFFYETTHEWRKTSSEEKLRYMMKNIINNHGSLRPTKKMYDRYRPSSI